MIERMDDLWFIYDSEPHAICCITTNGFVKANGKAVMGRGTARQAVGRFPGLAARLSRQLRHPCLGNHVQFIAHRLLAFPVKPRMGISDGKNIVAHMRNRFPRGTEVPGWAMQADPRIIERSLRELRRLFECCGWERVYLPRPGCGAGELDWETEVKPLCAQYGDWLTIVSRSNRTS